jgi:hypothetical protein
MRVIALGKLNGINHLWMRAVTPSSNARTFAIFVWPLKEQSRNPACEQACIQTLDPVTHLQS